MNMNAFSSSDVVQAEIADRPRFFWLSHAAAFVSGMTIAVIGTLTFTAYAVYELDGRHHRQDVIAYSEGLQKGRQEGREAGLKQGMAEGLKARGAEAERLADAEFKAGHKAGWDEHAAQESPVIREAFDVGASVQRSYSVPHWFQGGYLAGQLDAIKYNPAHGEWSKPSSHFSPTSAVILFRIKKLSQDHFDWLMSRHIETGKIECAGQIENSDSLLFVFVDEDDGETIIGVACEMHGLHRWSPYDGPIPKYVAEKLHRLDKDRLAIP